MDQIKKQHLVANCHETLKICENMCKVNAALQRYQISKSIFYNIIQKWEKVNVNLRMRYSIFRMLKNMLPNALQFW